MAKKKTKKVAKKTGNVRRHEVVVRVQNQTTALVPTSQELSEPLRDGKKLTLTKTWLGESQLHHILQVTPKQYVYERPGKGGMRFKYVTGSYVEKALNYIFGWNWDIEVVQEPTVGEVIQIIEKKIDQIWVTDKLIVRSSDGKQAVTKTQSGQAEIKFLKNSRTPVSIGNDIKAAHTDALKKCASLLGIASDIYGAASYKQETGNEPREPQTPVAEKPPAPAKNETHAMYDCHGARRGGCEYGAEITQAELDYSKKIFGRPLCRKCQADLKASSVK